MRSDIVVRQTVETIAAQPLIIIFVWNSELLCDSALSTVEGCVKARNLSKIRPQLSQSLNGENIVWQMQRRKRNNVF